MSSKGVISEKLILLGSILSSLFLLLMYLNATVFQSDFVLIGVFQELLTIPSVLIQPVLLFLAFKVFIREKYSVKSYSCFSILILSTSIIIILTSFFKIL